MHSLRILYFLKNIDHNGVTTTVLRLGKELARLGYQIGVASGGGHYLDELQTSGIQHYLVPFQSRTPLSALTNILLLSSVVRNFTPHVIHVQALSTSVYAKLFHVFYNIPFISTAHIVGIAKGTSIRHRLFYNLCYFGSKCVAVSSDVKHDIQARFRLSDRDIVTIINGLETDYFSPPTVTQRSILRRKHDISPDSIVISSIGRMGWAKGFHYLIYAAEGLRKDVDLPLVFLVAGGGDENHLKILEKEAVSHGVSDIFRFLGWSDSKEIYSLSDIFVLPTIQGEGFPTVVCEAMSMGLPTIRTNGEAARDQITDGTNGLIVEKRDVQGLINALKRCCVDKAYRLELGKHARLTAFENFSISEMAEKYTKLYSQLCA